MNNQLLARRRIIQTALCAAAAPCLVQADFAKPFSFVLLGDLHYDQLDHHDFQWLETHKASDLSQIKNYCRLTREVMPGMFAAVKQRIIALRESAAPPMFILQVGDLVEGLCGSAELAVKQNREVLEFVAKADFGLPFLFTKGNHDVTGDGAVEAFGEVLLPFMTQQAQRIDSSAMHSKANYTLTHADTQFAFFDAYASESLDWLEAVASKRTASQWFVAIHPPVVPYGARAKWHLFSDDRSASKRAKLLDILGQQEAIVLGGLLHKFFALIRQAGGKRFTQLAVSSVVSALDEKPRDVLHGIEDHNGNQVNLEPQHSPDTVTQRRDIYEVERKQVTAFDYANTAGFAVVTVNGGHVEAAIHAGSRQVAFQRVMLSA